MTKAKLLSLMGEAGEAILPNGQSLTRRIIEKASFVMPASSYVDFRIKKSTPTTRKTRKERKTANEQ